jgi:hypothetical protein
MRWAITHPAGLTRALGDAGLPELPPRFQEPRPRLLPLVQGELGGKPGAEARLSIYANGYFSRLHGALQADFPGLEQALGPDRFRELVAVHLLARPSTSASLADLGHGLAETLILLPAGTELPWTVDLARLERAVAEVWLAGNGPVGPLQLPESVEWASARMELAPTLRLLKTSWTVDQWRKDGVEVHREVRWLAVWRREAASGVESLGEHAWSTLQALAEGRTLEEACALAAALGASPALLLSGFSSWAERGWIARVVPGWA